MDNAAAEFSRRANLPQASKRHIDGGKRCQDAGIRVRTPNEAEG